MTNQTVLSATSGNGNEFHLSWKTLLGLLLKIVGFVLVVFGFPQASMSLAKFALAGDLEALELSLLVFSSCVVAVGILLWMAGSRLRKRPPNRPANRTNQKTGGMLFLFIALLAAAMLMTFMLILA